MIYYGDEIGMGDNIYLGDRNGVRTPMQWTGDRNAGFSRADSARLYAPPIMDPVYGYQAINVEAQERSPFSLLNWMRRMIALRKQFKVFGRGTLEFLPPAEPQGPGLHPRSYEDETILVRRQPLALRAAGRARPVARSRGMTPVEMFGQTEFPTIGELPYFLTSARTSFYWFRLQPAPAPVTARRAPETAPPSRRRLPGLLRRRGLGDAARGQRPHADRARGAAAVPAAPALVRRQGAARRARRASSTGACCAAARSRSSSPSSRSTTRTAAASSTSCR